MYIKPPPKTADKETIQRLMNEIMRDYQPNP